MASPSIRQQILADPDVKAARASGDLDVLREALEDKQLLSEDAAEIAEIDSLLAKINRKQRESERHEPVGASAAAAPVAPAAAAPAAAPAAQGSAWQRFKQHDPYVHIATGVIGAGLVMLVFALTLSLNSDTSSEQSQSTPAAADLALVTGVYLSNCAPFPVTVQLGNQSFQAESGAYKSVDLAFGHYDVVIQYPSGHTEPVGRFGTDSATRRSSTYSP